MVEGTGLGLSGRPQSIEDPWKTGRLCIEQPKGTE